MILPWPRKATTLAQNKLPNTHVNSTNEGEQLIVHVVGDSKSGGVTRVVQAICQCPESYQFRVVTTDLNFIESLDQAGIRSDAIEFVNHGWKIHNDLIGLWHLIRYFQHVRPDIVHTHRTKVGYVARVAAKLARVPVLIHTVHGLPSPDEGAWLQKHIITIIEIALSRLTNTSVAVSEVLAENLRAGIFGVGAKRVVLIQNGIAEPEVATPRGARRLVVQDEDATGRSLNLVFVGRLAEQKGLQFLLESVGHLRERLSVHLHLLGDGPLRTQLEETACKLGIRDVVFFHGFVRNPQTEMARADIIVLPSLWEGLSIALLEAMALAKPIVTTSIPSNCEVLTHNVSALLVPPRSPHHLSEAIFRLSQDPALCTSLGMTAREHYRTTYRQSTMVDKYHDLYKRHIQVTA